MRDSIDTVGIIGITHPWPIAALAGESLSDIEAAVYSSILRNMLVALLGVVFAMAEPTLLAGDTVAWETESHLMVLALGPSTELQLQPRTASDPWPTAWPPETIAVINAGYVDHLGKPTGWRVIEGTATQTIAPDPVQSGIAWLADGSTLRLSWRKDLPERPRFALQSGPFLIDPGGTLGINRPAGPLARRSALAVTSEGTSLVIISPVAVTLRAFAEAIQRLPAQIGVTDITAALNLDGGPATAMTIPGHPEWTVRPSGPIADVWMLIKRPPPIPAQIQRQSD